MNLDELSIETGPELDAVNDILSAIGEPPVTMLDGDANADVANARRILSRINRQIQSKGWTFNIEEGATLTPDLGNNMIKYLDDYLSVLSAGGASVYVNRQGWLLDRSANTDIFTGPIQVNLIRRRDYYEMPECFRTWIVTSAARMFNSRFFGSPEVEAKLSEEERDAKIACNEYEMDFGQFNMLDGDAFVQGQITR